jgi:hypothetical protein
MDILEILAALDPAIGQLDEVCSSRRGQAAPTRNRDRPPKSVASGIPKRSSGFGLRRRSAAAKWAELLRR